MSLSNNSGNNSAFQAIYNSTLDQPSIVLNGAGNITRFVGGFNTTTIPEPSTLVFKQYTRYLVRIINTSFSSTFVFSIDGHMLTVVEADFVPVHPYIMSHIVVGIGQRFHLIFYANASPDTEMTFNNY
jgi:FtsP/CotA-like multicopper oxidase with cupredoxin domain